MPDSPVKHVHDSRAFRQLQQLVDDFRERRCLGFFFFGLYPTGEETREHLQMQVLGNCLSPVEATDFQAVFYTARDAFDLQPGARSETSKEEACFDSGPDARAFSKGGNA